MLPSFLDSRLEGSLPNRMRRRRFKGFCSFIEDIPRPVRILDVGGTERFWEVMGIAGSDDFQVTVGNIYQVKTSYHNLRSVVVDGTEMRCFRDKEFDVVFSNSVIEHLGRIERMQAMANEVQRVGKRYFVQTPNRYFPLEPHFLFPFFQFLPLRTKVFLSRHLSLGWFGRFCDDKSAEREMASIRLLSESEVRKLFPRGQLVKELILGVTKSFIVSERVPDLPLIVS